MLVHRPDVVFIDYALNDRRESLEKVEEAWKSMILAAKKQDVPVVLLTPTGDLKADWKNSEAPLEVRAKLIRKLAEKQGVLLADVYAEWRKVLEKGTSQESLMSQGNHPNLKGHQLAAGVICRVFGP